MGSPLNAFENNINKLRFTFAIISRKRLELELPKLHENIGLVYKTTCQFQNTPSLTKGVIAKKPNLIQIKNVNFFSVFFCCHFSETVRAKAAKFSTQVDAITSQHQKKILPLN